MARTTHQPARTLARLFPMARMGLFDQFGDLLLRYGSKAFDAIAGLGPAEAAGLRGLIVEGLVVADGDSYRLTERGLAQLERSALESILNQLDPTREPREDLRRRDEPLTDRDLRAAMAAALAPGFACPLHVGPADVNRFIAHCRRTLSAILLADMGPSMAQRDRFHQAKRAALAIRSLVSDRFADDHVDVIGFDSIARPICREHLPTAMPHAAAPDRPGETLRIPLANASAAPHGFANLHMALQLAGKTLALRPGQNKAVFLVTDSQPTACVHRDELVLCDPPDESIIAATLAEAEALARSGVQLTTFALIDGEANMEWVDFIDRLTHVTRGASFFCDSEDLAGCVVETYLASKKA